MTRVQSDTDMHRSKWQGYNLILWQRSRWPGYSLTLWQGQIKITWTQSDTVTGTHQADLSTAWHYGMNRSKRLSSNTSPRATHSLWIITRDRDAPAQTLSLPGYREVTKVIQPAPHQGFKLCWSNSWTLNNLMKYIYVCPNISSKMLSF